MDKLWVVLLASSPFLTFIGWAVCWLVSDALRERRRTRAATRLAERFGPDRVERGDRGHASAA
ncbi:MAG: hypothetical protein GEV28_20270 [Actinophytocola sp.]|uniref:hypothetical protein n=1 Tax=Actinophytocola sp. TaxID=1872138 RepID=UPI00132566DC|nr:hypothetical protein [Actinophytocola sp.]MPZ82604.1 hypothetical protein [Actinophytocola sp.]